MAHIPLLCQEQVGISSARKQKVRPLPPLEWWGILLWMIMNLEADDDDGRKAVGHLGRTGQLDREVA
jgi:hypothetical protein